MKKNLLPPLLAALGLLGGLTAPGFAATPYLVADIDPRFMSDGSGPGGFVRVGARVVFATGPDGSLWSTAGIPGDPVRLGPANLFVNPPLLAAGPRAYFTGCAGSSGATCALWTTDGTAAGTRRLTNPTFFDRLSEVLTPPGSNRSFLVLDRDRGNELWTSNGTPAGTGRVRIGAARPRELTAFSGRIFFFADGGGASGALFSSDGTMAGTRRIGAARDGGHMIPLGNRLAFSAGGMVWSTDGTSAGTRSLVALPGSQLPRLAATANGRAFFFVFDSSGSGRDLWTSDGTAAGTRRLAGAGFNNSGEPPLVLGSRVAFIGNDPTHGQELWGSDGTTAGTRLVRDVCPGICTGAWQLGTVAQGRVWFVGLTPARGLEPWTSDLTAAGTRLVRDVCGGACSSGPSGWFPAGGLVYFLADPGSTGRQLFSSNGTPAGTRALPVGVGFDFDFFAAPLAGSSIVFSGADSEHGFEPWVSNGTPAGTRLIADLVDDNVAGSRPDSLASASGRCYFFANDGEHGRELWSSDGTEEGTRLAFELVPGPDSSDLFPPITAEAGGRLILFAPTQFQNGFDLLASDGTPAGSGEILPDGVVADRRHRQAGNRLFFIATDSAHGQELWTTDGTAAGTVRLTDLVAPDPFRPDLGTPPLFDLGGRLVAPALAAAGGEQLLLSDGTPGGTRPLAEVYPFLEEPLAQATSDVVEASGELFFVSGQAGDGQATLWHTDLTAGGTGPVGPLDLSNPTSRGWSLFALGGRLLLFGSAQGIGDALWASDGTAAGTRIVGPLDRPSSGVRPVVFDGDLWFAGRFGALFSSDGTAAGTRELRGAGDREIDPVALAVLGGRLVIATSSGFFESDGTTAGTLPIALPGGPPRFSGLQPLQVGERLFFPWSDALHGPELWALEP